MTAKPRLPARQQQHLAAAMAAARLERASFGFPTDMVSLNGGKPVHIDAFIKERVRLHHQSWVLGPLERLAKWGRGE